MEWNHRQTIKLSLSFSYTLLDDGWFSTTPEKNPVCLTHSLIFQSDTSSASEDEGSLRRKAALSAALAQSLQSPDYWINRSVQSSSTSSSASSTLSHGEPKTQQPPQLQPGISVLADVLAHTRIGNVSSLSVNWCEVKYAGSNAHFASTHPPRKQCPSRCDVLHSSGERIQSGPGPSSQGHESWTEPLQHVGHCWWYNANDCSRIRKKIGNWMEMLPGMWLWFLMWRSRLLVLVTDWHLVVLH